MALPIVSIVSGGWSASQVDLTKIPGPVIGVNNATLHMPRVDMAITMDRRWAEAYWPWIRERGNAGSLKAFLRRNNVCNIAERPDWLTIYKNDHKSFVMSDETNTLNGTNSGGVALNLAYSLKPRQLLLFGFDYRRGPKGQFHWFEPSTNTGVVGAYAIHDNRYRNWAREFEYAGEQFRRAGIEVLNVSDTTVVTAFKRVSPKEYSKAFA